MKNCFKCGIHEFWQTHAQHLPTIISLHSASSLTYEHGSTFLWKPLIFAIMCSFSFRLHYVFFFSCLLILKSISVILSLGLPFQYWVENLCTDFMRVAYPVTCYIEKKQFLTNKAVRSIAESLGQDTYVFTTSLQISKSELVDSVPLRHIFNFIATDKLFPGNVWPFNISSSKTWDSQPFQFLTNVRHYQSS